MLQNKKEHFLKWIFFSAARMRAGWRILIFFLFSIFLFLLLSLPFSFFLGGKGIQSDNHWDSLARHFFGVLLFAAVLLASWLMVRFFDKRTFASLGLAFDPGWWKEILFGLGAGFFLISFLFMIGLVIRSLETSWTLHDPSILIRLFLVLLIYAAFEETIFRGYPFQTLIEGIGKTSSVIILSAIFGVLHYFNPHSSMIGVVNTALAGAILSMLYIKRRSLWLPICVHFSWNFCMGPIFGLPVSGVEFKGALLTTKPIGSELFSGGEFGMEGSLLTTLLLVILIVSLIFSHILKPSEEMSKRWQDYTERG